MEPEILLKKMKDISYGWLDKDDVIHNDITPYFVQNYRLQSADEVWQSKTGVCWDQVEVQREFFLKENYNFKTMAIIYYDDKESPTHTFLIYQDKEEWHWFEHSWHDYRGIHKYTDKKALLIDVQTKFIKSIAFKKDYKNLCFYEYSKPKSGIGCQEFYKHCEAGINVRIDEA